MSITLTVKQTSPLLEMLIRPKMARRLGDIVVVISFGIIILLLTGCFKPVPLLIGVGSGVAASSWYAANFIRFKIILSNVDNISAPIVIKYFRDNSLFVKVNEFEFADARADYGFAHWKFENVCIKISDRELKVEAPLVHLRLLVGELQRRGYQLTELADTAVRIL